MAPKFDITDHLHHQLHQNKNVQMSDIISILITGPTFGIKSIGSLITLLKTRHAAYLLLPVVGSASSCL